MFPAILILLLIAGFILILILKSKSASVQQEVATPVPGISDTHRTDRVLVNYKGRLFREGDRVRVASRAGSKGPDVTGHSVDVESEPHRAGTVLSCPRPDRDVLLVRWDAQQWRESESGQWVSLGVFDDTIHADYLVHESEAELSSETDDAPRQWEAQYVKPSERQHLTKAKRLAVFRGLPQVVKDFLGENPSYELIGRTAREFAPANEHAGGLLAGIVGDVMFGFLSLADVPDAIEIDCGISRQSALRIAIRMTRHIIMPLSRFSCFQFGNVEAYVEDWKDASSGT